MSRNVHEETLLIPEAHDSRRRGSPPIPWSQFAILLLLQLSEPLTSQVIFPFAPQVSTEQDTLELVK
jgi:hypothetical protein